MSAGPNARRQLLALLTHARQVPASERERFASRLRAEAGSTALLVETCHRVEAYVAVGSATEVAALLAHLPSGGRVLAGAAAARHAIVVATGRDSVVVGEDQILHQLREASGQPAPQAIWILRPTGCSRWPCRPVGGPDRGNPAPRGRWPTSRSRPSMRWIGAATPVVTSWSWERGSMGGLLARVAARSGASVTIANRSEERARSLAASTGRARRSFDPGAAIGRFDAIVVALGGRWTIGREHRDRNPRSAARDRRPVGPVGRACRARGGPRLAVRHRRRSGASRRTEPSPDRGAEARTEALIDRTVQAFLDWQARGDARAAADALVRRADREREAELAALWRRLPALDPEAREAIEGMTRHLAARLLRQPLERLGRDADGIDGQAVRDLFAL